MDNLILPDNSKVALKKGLILQDIAYKYADKYKGIIVAALQNNTLVGLSTEYKGGELQLLDTSIEGLNGHKIYAKTITYLVAAAIRSIYNKNFIVKHGISDGIYCEIDGLSEVSRDELKLINHKVESYISNKMVINSKELKKDKLIEIFRTNNIELNDFEIKSILENCKVYYEIDGLEVVGFSEIISDCSKLTTFKLSKFDRGFIINYPNVKSGKELPKFNLQLSLANLYKKTDDFINKMNIRYISDVNKIISEGGSDELIRISEARYNRNISRVVDDIVSSNKKVILLAGPSSSGKTTTMKRIITMLKAEGKKVKTISVDDYFKGVDLYPLDKEGKPDFEHIEAVDVDLLNEHLNLLIQGETIKTPSYNFHKGCREDNGHYISLAFDELIFLEGIHCLNDRLTNSIPKSIKFKIYVSALTQLNIDSTTRISTSDTRLIRRMVRDFNFRGKPVDDTIRFWYKVRNGEYRNIYPYQDDADALIDTSLVYELFVLKNHAIKLLDKIEPTSKSYIEVQRLRKLLSNFKGIENEDAILQNSIIREFIGGSCFE